MHIDDVIKTGVAVAQTVQDNQDAPAVLTEIAKPWYLSKTVLAAVAGMILAVIVKFFPGELPAFVNQDNIVQFLLWFVPLLVTAISRFGATKIVTATPTAAKAINNTVAGQ